jgi:hypothetical protein
LQNGREKFSRIKTSVTGCFVKFDTKRLPADLPAKSSLSFPNAFCYPASEIEFSFKFYRKFYRQNARAGQRSGS